MWNVKIDPMRELQGKICLFGNFMFKNLFFEVFQIFIWDSYKKQTHRKCKLAGYSEFDNAFLTLCNKKHVIRSRFSLIIITGMSKA